MAKRKSTKRTINDLEKHTHKTKDRVIWTPLKTGGELMWFRTGISSCSTSCTRRVNLVTNPVISHEWGKNWETFTTNGTYPWSFVTQKFPNAMVATIKLSKWWLQLNQLNFISLIINKIKIKSIYTCTSIIYKYFHANF